MTDRDDRPAAPNGYRPDVFGREYPPIGVVSRNFGNQKTACQAFGVSRSERATRPMPPAISVRISSVSNSELG
jgi:hypothetical protein